MQNTSLSTSMSSFSLIDQASLDEFLVLQPGSSRSQEVTEMAQRLSVLFNREIFNKKVSEDLLNLIEYIGLKVHDNCLDHLINIRNSSGHSIDVLVNRIHTHVIAENSEEALRLIQFITELVIFCCYPNISPLSPDRIFTILEQAIISPQKSMLRALLNDNLYFGASTTIFQKIILLSHLNFCKAKYVYVLRNNPTFHQLFNSEHLPLYLMNCNIHLTQMFGESCLGASHNTLMQSRCASINELLFVLKYSISHVEKSISATDAASLQEPAFASLLGTPMSKHAYIEKKQTQINNILKNLLDNPHNRTTSREVQELTQKWNGAMQHLALILNPNRLVVPTAAGTFGLARAGANSFLPGEPSLSSSKLNDISSEELYNIEEQLFACKMSRHVGEMTDLNSSDRTISISEIWKQVFFAGGCFIRKSNYSTLLGRYGHLMACYATVQMGRQIFLHRDPLNNAEQSFTLDEMDDHFKIMNSPCVLVQDIDTAHFDDAEKWVALFRNQLFIND